MDAAAHAREAIGRAITELSAAGARTETLAEYRPAHRRMLIPRAATFVTVGPVWRLGVLLLRPTGELYATGAVTRARDPKHPNFTSVSGEERRELREAARKAGFGDHDTVNFDAIPLSLEEPPDGGPGGGPGGGASGTAGPLVWRGEELTVSWNGTRSPESLRPFVGYLRERVELAAHPPEGA